MLRLATMQEISVSAPGFTAPLGEAPATRSKRDKIILASFIVSTLLQCWLVARITYMEAKERTVRHFAPLDSWYVFNVVLAGAVLVAMAAVLRTEPWRQRLVALVLCICPIIFLNDLCRWCMAVISQP